MSGIFSILNTATKGINSQQTAISTTAHNIANANTEGYSRQTVKLTASRPFSTPSFNSTAGPGQLGTGVDVASIERIRNTFLDYQVRQEKSIKGQYDTRSQYLSNIEGITNEPTDTGISSAMDKFYIAWQDLASKPEDSNNRTVVVQNSLALCDMLNKSYNELTKTQSDIHDNIKQSITDINSILDKLDSINQEIIQIKVSGQSPNDLMDSRDLLLDQLSEKMGINVDRSPNFEGNDISPTDTNGVSDPTLVKSVFNDQVKRFSYVSNIEAAKDSSGNPITDGSTPPKPVYNVTYYSNGDMSSSANEHTFQVSMSSDEYSQLNQSRVLWANSDGKAISSDGNVIKDEDEDPTIKNFSDIAIFKPQTGELAGLRTIQSDVDNYMDKLNSFAKALAYSVNTLQIDNSVKGQYFFVNASTGNSDDNITAGNITVNKNLQDDVMKIITGQDSLGISDNSVALAIAQLKDVTFKIQDINSNTDRNDFITTNNGGNPLSKNEKGIYTFSNTAGGMTIQGYYKDTIDKLGIQSQQAKNIVQNQDSLLNQFDSARTSVSGVSIDEEMTNLIQFQHAYTANAKIISTVDQLMDVIINGLKK